MNTPKNGFTLIEILIVVVILGVLASIVIPAYSGYKKDSHKNAFVTCIKAFADIASYHYQKEGEYFEDAESGQIPTGWDDYILSGKWTNSTPIGGQWDFEQDSYGIHSAIGVHFDGTGETRDDDYMQEIDQIFDDGDLSTGAFRKLDTDRYYYIVAVSH